MKRPVLLFALLILATLTWAGLVLKDRQWHQWLMTARRDELERYVTDHPDQSDALIRLGVLLRATGEREQAEKLVRHAVEVAPNEETNWIEFSRTLADDKEAVRGLQNFLKVWPENGPVTAELARQTLKSGDVAAARTLSERATTLAPKSPDAWRVRGDVMAALRQLPEAEKDYRVALSLHDDTETRLSLARMLIPLQRYAEIVTICSPIVKTGQSPTISQEQRARALLYTAGARLYDPLTPEEIAALQSQLREVDSLSANLPADERFLTPYFLGESFLRLGRPREAIPFLKRSVAAGPMYAGSLYSLSRAYRLSGDTEDAEEAARRHARLSRILGELEMYSNRLEQRPDDAGTLLRLAGTLTEAGNVTEAAQIYQRLIAKHQSEEFARRKLDELSVRP